MTVTTVALGLCVAVSSGAAAYAGSNLGAYLGEAYRNYVEAHKDVYTFGEPVTFETPDGVTIVVSGSEPGGGANADSH